MRAAYDRVQRKMPAMNSALDYVFDPLCGGCYGALPAMVGLARSSDVTLRLRPTGLFSGSGARPMSDDFAAYAWSNDQRIESFTGQRFTERYRAQVLGDRRQPFDSGCATLALTAVALSAPARALAAIQQARYVDGLDVTSLTTLARLQEDLGLAQAGAKRWRVDASAAYADPGALVTQPQNT